MKENHKLAISDFSRITGISRYNLIFYDKIDLLKPHQRDDNGYRLYSRTQLDTAFVIVALREIGVSIETIKQYVQERNTEAMLALFHKQSKVIQQEIDKLKRLKKMMQIYSDSLIEVSQVDLDVIQMIECQEEAIFIGPKIAKGIPEEEANVQFYNYADQHKMELSYPLGAIVDVREPYNKEEKLQHFYLRVGQKSNGVKPAGSYVVGYLSGNGYDAIPLYKRLLAFIEAHDLLIDGYAYEEYPTNEVIVKDELQYVIKLQIKVNVKTNN